MLVAIFFQKILFWKKASSSGKLDGLNQCYGIAQNRIQSFQFSLCMPLPTYSLKCSKALLQHEKPLTKGYAGAVKKSSPTYLHQLQIQIGKNSVLYLKQGLNLFLTFQKLEHLLRVWSNILENLQLSLLRWKVQT